MTRLRNRWRSPVVLLVLACVILVAAGASWSGWVVIRNNWRDGQLRQRTSASRPTGGSVVNEPLLVLRGHTRKVNQVAYSPDGDDRLGRRRRRPDDALAGAPARAGSSRR